VIRADAGALRYAPAVTLLTDLDAFYVDHRRCDELEAGVDGAVVWISCDCGASMARRADEGDHGGEVSHQHQEGEPRWLVPLIP
jgi:hypothetical protein